MERSTAVAVGWKRRRWGGWSVGSRGIDCVKGVDSERWVAAGESVGSGGGGGGGINYDSPLLLSFPCFS